MDVSTYYITTLMNAAMKLGPLLIFVVVGYFIFIKLPFLFFLRNMGITKKEFEQKLPQAQDDYSVDNYKDFQRRMKLLNSTKTESQQQKKEEKKEEKKEQRQERAKNQERREQPRKTTVREPSPEEVFELRPGERLTQAELRKRYHDLLKKNHPDRVASMGAEFKKLAEKNTKDINQAYEKLKKKAA